MKKGKKLLVALFTFALLFTQCLSVSAASVSDLETTVAREYLDDGSGNYYEIVITKTNGMLRTTQSYYATKTFKNSSGTALWYVKVSGTFNYNGSSCTCTSASSSAGSYNDNWKIISHSASRSGNSATAYATAKRYTLGVPVETENTSITLHCDANGNPY